MESHRQSFELLFSYGTLQMEKVQISTYGRLLSGKAARITGYRLEMLNITNKDVIETSGLAQHPVAVKTGLKNDFIDGTCFELTEEELHKTDIYENSDYIRESASIDSGASVWIYVQKNTI